MKKEINLHDTIDAVIWTDGWLKTISKFPGIPTDRDAMIGWFANSIMAGYDAGRRAEEKRWTSKIKSSESDNA
jgi:hypothetical protein